MNDHKLKTLVEKAKSIPDRTPRSVSRRSWVLGELTLRYPHTPKEDLERITDQAIHDLIRSQNKKP